MKTVRPPDSLAVMITRLPIIYTAAARPNKPFALNYLIDNEIQV